MCEEKCMYISRSAFIFMDLSLSLYSISTRARAHAPRPLHVLSGSPRPAPRGGGASRVESVCGERVELWRAWDHSVQYGGADL